MARKAFVKLKNKISLLISAATEKKFSEASVK
jgi:hypothetical protein